MAPPHWIHLGEAEGVTVQQDIDSGDVLLGAPMAEDPANRVHVRLTPRMVVELARLAVRDAPGGRAFDELMVIAHVKANPRLALYRVQHGTLWNRKYRIA